MPHLAPATASRLTKLLSLTQSDIDAEALAAIRAANRAVMRDGSSWQDIIMPQICHRPAEDKTTARDDIAWCLDHGDDALTDWDRKFLVSLQTFSRYSEKQIAVLDRIVRKCRTAAR